MEVADFVIVGSSGGGGTIAWVLAKAGFKVVVLEQGADWYERLSDDLDRTAVDPHNNHRYSSSSHDEYRFRIERPEFKRRLRGDYNTFRRREDHLAEPFYAGWTGSMLGGGSVIWGAWAFRALPIDFVLGQHFRATGQDKQLKEWGYDVIDWPVSYKQMEPYYNVAETLLAVSGDRSATNDAVTKTDWYEAFKAAPYWNPEDWTPKFEFPCPPMPRTPVGEYVARGFANQGWKVAPLPSGMVSNAKLGAAKKSGKRDADYRTRAAIEAALSAWGKDRPEFWHKKADEIWSDRIRSACNMCGFCGEYLCWGLDGPKSGSRVSTLREIETLDNVEIITSAKAYEVIYDPGTRRAQGVRYLDVTDPEHPKPRAQRAKFVIVSCGAVQSARLLLLSGPPCGLGNQRDLVGRYATWHLFGLGAKCVLDQRFQGQVHGELAHTGNVVTFDNYFVEDPKAPGTWWKAGTMVSTAKKNPLENAVGAVNRSRKSGSALRDAMEDHSRTIELRLTGDDLPMYRNRVDLDPRYVDEHGLPVARITRDFGPAEKKMFELRKTMEKVLDQDGCVKEVTAPDGTTSRVVSSSDALVDLIGDHQMGTCRMGHDPNTSVLDPNCRLHECPNVFVVDTSFMPTGFGLNPMVTVVANALRVGTWIVQESRSGTALG